MKLHRESSFLVVMPSSILNSDKVIYVNIAVDIFFPFRVSIKNEKESFMDSHEKRLH